MAVKLNEKTVAFAKKLIEDGKVDKDSPWSISADEENEMLGDDNWVEYGNWFLGNDEDEGQETKAHYKYPIGKGGKVYRSALIGDRKRSTQQDQEGIFDAAGELIDLIDGKENDKGDEKGAVDLRGQARVAATPWALMPECINSVVGFLASGNRATDARPVSARPVNGGQNIAVLSLTGVIDQHPSWMCDTDLDSFMSDFMMAMNDPSISAILMCIDSPGGSVYGVQEAAAVISAATKTKPVIAFANSLAASAAYWLGCAASEFYCTPSGEVGSIGVWQAHMDISGMLESAGVNVTLISAGQFKVEGNPYEPLTDDAQAFMQSRVDDYYGAFCNAVAQARGVSSDVVMSGMGQGRVLGAAAAKKAGMIDDVMTFSQVVSMLQKRMAPAPAPRKSRLEKAEHTLRILG